MANVSKNPIVSLTKYMWEYSRGNRRNVVWFMILSTIANVLLLSQPIIVGAIFNAIQFSVGNDRVLQDIFLYLSMLLGVNVLFWVFHGPSRVMERKNAFLVRKNYKTEVIDKVLDLPVAWHKNHHSGETIDKVNKAADNLYNFSGNFFMIISNGIKLFGSIAVLAYFSIWASVVVVLTSVVTIIMLLAFDKRLIKGYRKVFKYENHLASAVHDYISNILTVVTLRLKSRVNKEVLSRSLKALPTYNRNNKLNETKWFSATIMITFMTVGVLGVYSYQEYTATGLIMIGTLFTLFRYLQDVGNTFYSFAWRYGEIVEQNTAVVAGETILEEYENLVEHTSAELPHEWKNIEIKNLMFVYKDANFVGKQKHHIKNVSLNIQRGSRIAFIGESGSGKSTTLALIRGLHIPNSVTVAIDGKCLSGGLSHLYDHTTLFPQDPEIFNSTLKDNITMDTKVTAEELQFVISMARFDGVPRRLKKGLQTNVMEKGVSLSGGEKQRLALARGILSARNSDLLLFDEPTSSVDASTEVEIYENIFKSFKDVTIISSFHRLHLLRYFDYVYYFKNGTILTEGTFADLQKNANFQKLWNNYTKSEKEQ